MKVLKTIDQILEFIQNWILIITGTAVTGMILVNALFRIIKVDWFGSEELTLFVAFWLYFMGAACASREDTHISADMVALFTTNPKKVAVIGVIKSTIGMIMSAVFTIWCFRYVSWQMGLGAKSAVYKLPVVIATIPILICFALWTLYLIRDIIRYANTLTGKDTGSDNTKGDD